MIEDFILANELKAKIEPRLIKHPDGAVCELFFADTKKFLLIHLVHDALDLEKVKKVLRVGLVFEPSETEVEDLTGYKKGFLPLISIYGFSVVIDQKIMKKDLLFTFLNDGLTLVTPVNELKEFNE
ncbi:MAG: YbaK/EbsC family protein, partial [Candidatus Diapherotrites archaeon]|nr:YbaK/EbsC family protein [Candidatus Diapherotrites archaeon]